MIMSTLSVRQCNPKMTEFLNVKPILLCSFGNLDLLKPFNSAIKEILLEKPLRKREIKNQFLEDFYRCVQKIKVCKESISARKDWLI